MKPYIVIGFLLVLILASIYFFSRSPFESDQSLIANFQRHRSSFEEIVRMMDEDSNVLSVYEEYVSIKGNPTWRGEREEGFSTKRWLEYKALFARLGSRYIYRASKDGAITHIDAATVATAEVDGDTIVISKGYAYSTKLLQPSKDTLDDMDFSTTRTFYRPIGDNWYLFFDYGISKPE